MEQFPANPDAGAWQEFERLVAAGAGLSDHPSRRPDQTASHSPEELRYVLSLPEHHRSNTIPFLLDHCRLSGLRVLEFGAGTGGLSVAMVQSGIERVEAIEPVRINYEAGIARTSAHRLQDRIGFHHVVDTSRLPFGDETFGACVCSSVLQYVPETGVRAKLLREMWRVVEPGGLIVICQTGNASIPGGPHSSTWWSNLLPAIAARAGHDRGVSYWELSRVLGPLGCTIVLPKDGNDSELVRWRGRHGEQPGALRDRALRGAFVQAYSLIEWLGWRVCGLPVDVFMPYLFVAFQKRHAALAVNPSKKLPAGQ